jgi:transglutaminase-like putative cysteine protease
VQRTEARTEVLLTRTLALRSFAATVRGPGMRFTATGRVEGDTLLMLELASDESRDARRVPLDEPIMLPQLLPLRVAYGGGLTVGRTFSVQMFDPVLLETRDAAVEVAAESTFVVPKDTAVFDSAAGRWHPIVYDTVRAWRVREVGRDAALDTWIDDRGQLVAAWSPAGFRLERTAFEVAYENFRLEGERPATPPAGDLIRGTAIAGGADLEPAALASLTVRLTGQPLDGLDLAGGRQRRAGDTVAIRREAPGELRARYRVPDAGAALRPFMAPEPLIQSDDPRLQAQARQILGGTRRPELAAERLTRWVYGALAKEVTLSVPSALDVYARRRGDCNEHTVLYVALARAVGLPARIAAGLVYLDGRFYYHAWPEVWLNDWVAVDPTFGQFPADAAHVRLTVGGLARQLELVRLIGRLGVEVVTAEAAT